MRRRCLECGRIIDRGSRCPRCTAEQKQPYTSPAYQQLRLHVLQRDHYRCQLQHLGCTGHATTVDHLNQDKTDNRMVNLAAACLKCNSGKRNR